MSSKIIISFMLSVNFLNVFCGLGTGDLSSELERGVCAYCVYIETASPLHSVYISWVWKKKNK
jgi:hypothetical protein